MVVGREHDKCFWNTNVLFLDLDAGFTHVHFVIIELYIHLKFVSCVYVLSVVC